MYLQMDPTLHYHPPRISEAEDLAADFVEQVIGRHDWMNNWPVWKGKNPDYRERIRSWLEALGENLDPEELIQAIERMKLLTPGKWK